MGDQKYKISTIDPQQLYVHDAYSGENDAMAAAQSFSNVTLDEELCNKLTFAWGVQYKPEDIDGGLATDFDGSLQGLGVEVEADAYDMSEALLALPVFKQENLDYGFQYILNAATSPATKLNEDTLTYLNQGQSYEVKLKCFNNTGSLKNKTLTSVVRVLFHERRLQYMEKEQIEYWQKNRPGERILDLDVPLSYRIKNIKVDPKQLNSIEFSWDPNPSDAGVYIKVNCISTEFTAKKHGGEKGVPFRIQIDTYENDENNGRKLIYSASSQIKVFKPKGADRKHKTDREKMEKRSDNEKTKYQPSYNCTVLAERSLDQESNYPTNTTGPGSGGPPHIEQNSPVHAGTQQQQQPLPTTPVSVVNSDTPVMVSNPITTVPDNNHLGPKPTISSIQSLAGQVDCRDENEHLLSVLQSTLQNTHLLSDRPFQFIGKQLDSSPSSVSVQSVQSTDQSAHKVSADDLAERVAVASNISKPVEVVLTQGSTSTDVTQWLHNNRFSSHVHVFQNFAGSDLLRLSRDDLIQICGLADGIRLNNALQSKTVRPRLTIYVCQEPQQHHQLSANPTRQLYGPPPGQSISPPNNSGGITWNGGGNERRKSNQDDVLSQSPNNNITKPIQTSQPCTSSTKTSNSSGNSNKSSNHHKPPASTKSSTQPEGSAKQSIIATMLSSPNDVSSTIPSPRSSLESSKVEPSASPLSTQNQPQLKPRRVLGKNPPGGGGVSEVSPATVSHGNKSPTVPIPNTGNASNSLKSKRLYDDEELDIDDVTSNKKQRTRCLEMFKKAYHALYLEDITVQTLISKIANLYSITSAQIIEAFIYGPNRIMILVNDEVVANFKDLSLYAVDAIQDDKMPDKYRLYIRSLD